MRREFPKLIRRQAYLRACGHCESCGARLTIGHFEFHHTVPCALGGESTLENCLCVCIPCHRETTAKEDIPRIAKAKRVSDRHLGIRKPSRFPCARTSRWKKKLDGSVVPR
ncbi:MAG: HNH endonuclease [Alphaproteobacteria bacterium]|nr:HNH endonuclease [Alphaproteobacteria bacterium]